MRLRRTSLLVLMMLLLAACAPHVEQVPIYITPPPPEIPADVLTCAREPVDPAAYTLTVWNAELVRGRWLDADPAAYVWGGSDAALSQARRRINMFPQTF